MLERVALHQTRLRVPGVALDARGVVLGARGLVLLPSIDRLVAFLAVYTGAQPLEAISATLRIEVARSQLGTREIALSFDAGSSDRMDRVAEVAELAGGFTFTGTSRHYVQYRDRSAPFGYDAAEITATDAALVLYHTTFSQVYGVERPIDLRELLLRLMPHLDPAAEIGSGPIWILAEPGLGPSLLSYFTRSGVEARVGMADSPPETSFDDGPRRRWLFRVSAVPARMRKTLGTTPGLTVFLPAGAGVAVERGFRHPIALAACPVFGDEALALFRGRAPPALLISPLPVLAEVGSLMRAELGGEAMLAAPAPGNELGMKVGVALRLVPRLAPPSSIAATLIAPEELATFRRIVYALGAETVRSARIAVTQLGAFVVREQGIEVVPLGTFYRRVHASLYVLAGYDVAPAVGPDTLFQALGAPAGRLLFFGHEPRVVGVDESAFVPLEAALLQAEKWAPVDGAPLERAFATETPVVWLEPLGMLPMKNAELV